LRLWRAWSERLRLPVRIDQGGRGLRLWRAWSERLRPPVRIDQDDGQLRRMWGRRVELQTCTCIISSCCSSTPKPRTQCIAHERIAHERIAHERIAHERIAHARAEPTAQCGSYYFAKR
jgi:hypothetical protein